MSQDRELVNETRISTDPTDQEEGTAQSLQNPICFQRCNNMFWKTIKTWRQKIPGGRFTRVEA